MKRVFELIRRFWAPIAILLAMALLGASKVKRKEKRAKKAGDLYRAEITSDMSELSDVNKKARLRAHAADHAAADAKKQFRSKLDEISNSSDSLSDILSDYNSRRLRE